MESIFFNSWFALMRTAIVGGLAYIGLIVLLRVSGKRTLSKMNAFDLVVTVALGSTLATITLSADVALAQGLVALALLIVLQFAITWSSVRWQWVRRAVTGEPSLLFSQSLPARRAPPSTGYRRRSACGRSGERDTLPSKTWKRSC